MNSNISEIPFLKNIGFMLTYKCSVACPHCIVEAGPHRKEEIQLDEATDWIKQANEYRDGYIKGIALTGGEPFLNIDSLEYISTVANKFSFTVSVVTNAFWAVSKNTARNLLAKLPAIKLISISTDVYHQKVIPFGNIENAIWAAKEIGLLYNVAVCTDNEEDENYKKTINDLLKIIERDKIKTSITLPVGRALKRSKYFKYRISPEPTISACSMGSTPIIFPDGKVIACIGPVIALSQSHPLFLGNLRNNTLSEIFDKAETNLILHAIRIWGPKKLISLIKELGQNALLPKEYIAESICDACYKLMSNEKIVDLLNTLSKDEQLKQKIAYARIYYLNETKMAELYHLDT